MTIRIFIDALVYKTKMSLKAEIARFYLHFLWWIITPLLSMAVYYIVFEKFLSRGTEHFAVFLLCGLVHWDWFAKSTMAASASILGGKSILTQVNIPKIFFPLEALLKELFRFTITICLLFIFLTCNGFYPSSTWLFYPLLLLVQCVLIIGVAVFFSSIVPLCEDLRPLLDTVIRLLFFGSGVFYQISDIVSPEYTKIILLNPMAGLLIGYRSIFIDEMIPDLVYLMYVFVLGVLFFSIGLLLLRIFNVRYVQRWHQ